MSAVPTMPPELAKILQRALADAHHAVAGRASEGEVATRVIDHAAAEARLAIITAGLQPTEIDGTWSEGVLRYHVLSGLAALLYASQQDLLAKLDALGERIEYLQIALTHIAVVNKFTTMATVRQFATNALDVDDRVAALDDDADEEQPRAAGHVLRAESGEPDFRGECALCGLTNVVEGERCGVETVPSEEQISRPTGPDKLPDPIARVRAAVIQAQIQTGISLARGPFRQNDRGKLTDKPVHVVAATPMGLILQASDPGLRGTPIARAAAQVGILIASARAIDAGFRGEPCPVGGVETWHALGIALADESGLPPVETEEG